MTGKRSKPKAKTAHKQKMSRKWKNPGKSNASTNPNRTAPGKEGEHSYYRSKVTII